MTLPDAELAVLAALWDGGPAAARPLARRVYDSDTASAVATVQTLLGRLERKGFVDRDRSAKAHLFSAAVSREGFAGAELAGLAEKLSAGSLTPLLCHLADAGRLTAADLDELRATLAAREARGA